MNEKRKSFSLAEVLVVIFLLGVISIETIPTLISSYQNNIYKKSLKKSYSAIQRGVFLMMNERGTDTLIRWSSIGCFAMEFNRSLKSYKILNMLKTADCGEANGYCWHPGSSAVHGVTYLDGSPMGDYGTWACSMTADGIMFRIVSYGIDCPMTTSNGDHYCYTVEVDINGFKKPNKYGRDIYDFFIMSDGQLKPFGYTNQGLDCNTDDLGTQCAYKVLMNIDY